jgi:hypothetical protein
MGKDTIGAEAVVADAVGVDVTAGAPLEGSGRGDGEATSAAQPTTESESHRIARARYMGPTLYDAQSRGHCCTRDRRHAASVARSDDADSSHTSGTPGQIFKDLPVITSERKTGVKHAEVITARVLQDERGWLRLVGLRETRAMFPDAEGLSPTDTVAAHA